MTFAGALKFSDTPGGPKRLFDTSSTETEED